jgi:PhnB protein
MNAKGRGDSTPPNPGAIDTKIWKPANYPSVSPYLICGEAEKLIEFVVNAFDGVVLRRFTRPNGSLMHVEILIDDSILMIGGGATEHHPVFAHIHLYVPDALQAFNRAVAAGATIVSEPQRKRHDDDLRGGVCDPFGVTWWIASQ